MPKNTVTGPDVTVSGTHAQVPNCRYYLSRYAGGRQSLVIMMLLYVTGCQHTSGEYIQHYQPGSGQELGLGG